MERTHLYIEVHGEDREHAERNADTVAGIIRGIGLTTITEDTNGWPGGCDTFPMTEDGTTIRLHSRWDTFKDAQRAGQLVKRWLEANLWAHHGSLGMVWTVDHVNQSGALVP